MTLRFALAPLAPRPGDLPGNAALLRAARARAAAAGAALLVSPQASLSGAGLLDLGRDPAFLAACEETLRSLAAETADGGPALLLGLPWQEGGRVFDGLALLDGGRVLARRARHAAGPAPFAAGPAPGPVAWRELRLGLLAGEDLDDPSVAETLAETGAELLLCLAAPAFVPGAETRAQDQAVARVVETGLPLLWLGLEGGQGEEVCAGGAFALNADRSLALRLPFFTLGPALADWDGRFLPQPLPPAPAAPALLWSALQRGIADHLRDSGHAAAALAPGEAHPGRALLALCAGAALGGALLPAPRAGGGAAVGAGPGGLAAGRPGGGLRALPGALPLAARGAGGVVRRRRPAAAPGGTAAARAGGGRRGGGFPRTGGRLAQGAGWRVQSAPRHPRPALRPPARAPLPTTPRIHCSHPMSATFDQNLFAPEGGFAVRIRDLSGGNGAEPVETIRGFPTLAQANAFARRYVRDSIERCRARGMDAEAVLAAWFSFGEDAEVVTREGGAWNSGAEIRDFAAKPVTEAEDRNWRVLDPRRDEEDAADGEDEA